MLWIGQLSRESINLEDGNIEITTRDDADHQNNSLSPLPNPFNEQAGFDNTVTI